MKHKEKTGKMRYKTAIICIAATLGLSACGPKHDAEKTAKRMAQFSEVANKAAEDCVLSETEIDNLLYIYKSIENTEEKYKNAKEYDRKEYDKCLEHVLNTDTKSNYIGAMMLVGYCQGADIFSKKTEEYAAQK